MFHGVCGTRCENASVVAGHRPVYRTASCTYSPGGIFALTCGFNVLYPWPVCHSCVREESVSDARMSEDEVVRGAMVRYHQDATFHTLVDTAVSVVDVVEGPLEPCRRLSAMVAAVALVLDDHRRREAQPGRLSTRHPLEQDVFPGEAGS